MGYHVYLPYGTSVRWHTKTQLVLHTCSYKLLINDVKSVHSHTEEEDLLMYISYSEVSTMTK